MAPVIPGDLLTEGVAVEAIGIEVIETMEPLAREGSELSVGKLAVSKLIEVIAAVQPLRVVKGAELLAMRELIVSHKRLMPANNVMRDMATGAGPAAPMVVVLDAAEMRSAPTATEVASGEVRTAKMGAAKVATTKMAAAEVTAKAAVPCLSDRDGACYPEKDCADCDYRPHGRVSQSSSSASFDLVALAWHCKMLSQMILSPPSRQPTIVGAPFPTR